jgi:hypothetical protein
MCYKRSYTDNIITNFLVVVKKLNGDKIMSKNNQSGDKFVTSIYIDKDVHYRIRELMGFNHGGFPKFLDVSLRVLLPFIESYCSKHKRNWKNKNILLTIADDTETDFDYELIGRQVISVFREKVRKNKGVI